MLFRSEIAEITTENANDLTLSQPESSLDKDSEDLRSLRSLRSSKNHVSENVFENTHQFQVGDRVKPSDPFHERGQDAGIVESIEGEQYAVQWQSDRNLRRYTCDELQPLA